MKVCSACGNELPINFRYCGYCGASLITPSDTGPAATTPGPIDNQSAWRPVTVLFADLSNYTKATTHADPEIVYHTVRELFERVARSVRKHGGYIDRYVGDGFLAAFGLPEAHEDDPIRSLRAAQDIQQNVADVRHKVSQSLNWEMQLRIGINTGPVIKGQIDTGSLHDASVFGHTVNLAHRLHEAARPGTILVSEAIYRRARAQFDFSDPIKLQLKGIEKPVIGFELIGLRLDPQPIRGLTGRKTELVGRQVEFESLSAAMQRLKVEGTGVIALVTGPAGIGKTRLVDDVLAQLAGQFNVIRAGCSPTEMTSYALLTTILENLAGILPDDPGPVRRQRVDDLLFSAGTMTREVGPALYELVGAPAGDEKRPDDPQQQQRRILGAIRRLFAWMARRQAMVLVIDDMQWADPSSLHVLTHISDLVTEVPLVLVAVARSPSYQHLASTFIRSEPAWRQAFCDFALQPLSVEESELLVTLLLSQVPLPPALRRSIVDRGGGNPLLIEELVRMLLDQDVIRQTPAGWHIEERWPEVVQKVPDTVNGLILSRYDCLPAGQKQVLLQAAILGPSFSLPLLLAMTGSPEPELRNQLRSLEEADFLRRSASGSVPNFLFRHALLHEAIYETLLQSESRSLHLRAAQAIEGLTDDLAAGSAALIGHHLERASSPQAFAYLMQAAAQAADRYANQEAISCFRRAEALLDPERPDPEQAIDVALGLAEMLARVNQLEQARETLERARSRFAGQTAPVHRLGDIQYQLGRVFALQGDHAGAVAAFELSTKLLEAARYTLSDVEQEIGWVLCRQGKLGEARSHAEKALTLALEQANPRAVAGAYNLLTPVHYWAGRLNDAVESAREALAIREQIGDIWGAAGTQTNLAGIYHRLGRWEQAESLLRQAVFVRQEIGDHQGVVLSSNILGLLLIELGRYDEAMDWLEQAFATLQRQTVLPDFTSQLYGNRGLLWLRMGEPELARADLETCIDFADQVGNTDLRALALAYLAESWLNSAEIDRARDLIDEGSALCGDNGSPEIRAELLRVRSLLLKAEQRWVEAIQANRQALELYQEIGNRYEVAHLQLEAAETQLACQECTSDHVLDASTARTELLEALTVFHELPAQALIPRAEEALGRISTRIAKVVSDEALDLERPVVLAHFKYRLPAGASGETPGAAAILERMEAELRHLGRSMGAATVGNRSGVFFLFSQRDPDASVNGESLAVKSARSALDIGIRLNRASQRQHDLRITLTAGIVSGLWQGAVHDLNAVMEFVSTSPAGEQAVALTGLEMDNAILLTAAVAQSIRDSYELDQITATMGPVWRLGRARAEIGIPQALPGSARRLIGRDAEVGKLKAWIDKVHTESRGFVCYLEAEAGMGKTRLIEEVLAYAQPAMHCLSSKCEAFRSNISYWPLVDMLEHGFFAETDASRRLKSMLALRPPDDADEALLRNIAPANMRQELFGRLRTFLLELASNRPLLLVLEDIHCIDLSSLELIDFILPLTTQAAISLMLVARAEMPGPHRALVSRAERVCRDSYFRITFSSLSEEESADLIHNLLEAPDLPDQLWQLAKPFAGHPLSLEEVLRFLIERGWLWRTNGRWQVTSLKGRPGVSMPATFRDLVLGRLDALDKETLHIFQSAAVLGEQFDRTVLGRIVPRPALSRRLTELVERGWLIAPSRDHPHLYRFKHTLTRETVYSTLLTSKRQLVHQRAGEAIRALYPEAEEENVELMAHHFTHSSLREESLHYLVRAAEKSAARYALAESLGYFMKAEETLAALPHLRSRLLPRVLLGLADVHLLQGEPANAASRVSSLLDDAALDPSPEVQAAALRRLAESRREMAEFPAALAFYQDALILLDGEVTAEQMADHERWEIGLGVAQTLFDMRENRRAKEEAERVMNNIDRRVHARLAADTLNLLGGIAYRQRDLETASHMVRQSLSINQLIGNRAGAASDYANLGVLAAAGQSLQEARESFVFGLQIHEELGDSRGVAITQNNLGQLELNRGRFAEAIEHLERGATTAQRSELSQVLAQSLANLGQAFVLAGRPNKAFATLEDAESICERYGFKNLHCEVLWKRADALVNANDLAAAEVAAMAARKLAEELGSGDLKSEAQRALARTLRKIGRPALAVEEAGAAWQSRASHPNPVTRARFAAEYALALLDIRQPDQARQLMREQVAPVTLYEAPAVVREIDRALKRLGIKRG